MPDAALTGGEFKKQLRAGTPKMGLFLNAHSPTVAEQLAHSGYDWLLVDTQHGPMGFESLSAMLSGISNGGVKSLVRVQHESPDADQVKLTAEGSVGGTPAYMAPEVALGEAIYDHRIDIYAVGCIGYWLLTGKLVFEADTPMKMIVEHARTPPARPQTRTELPIPPELEQIIMDCLEKDPARRPATAGELAGRLARVPVPQQWTAERAERWWRTHLPQQTQEPTVSEVLLAHEGSPQSPRELRRRRAD